MHANAQVDKLIPLDEPTPNVTFFGTDCHNSYEDIDSISPDFAVVPEEGDAFLKLEYADTNFLSECVIEIGFAFDAGNYQESRLSYDLVFRSDFELGSQYYKENLFAFLNGSPLGGLESKRQLSALDTFQNWREIRSSGFDLIWNSQNKEVDSIVLRLMFNQFTERTAFRLYLDNVRLYLSGTASVNERAQNLLRLYPNPAQHSLQLVSQQFWQRIECYDAQGRLRKVFDAPSTGLESRLDISDLVPGIYFLSVEMEDGSTAYGRFVKGGR